MTAITHQITPNSTMEEILHAYPGAKRALFRAYHIGGCGSCGFQASETLDEVCARKGGIDSNQALAQIQKSHEDDMKMFIEPAELQKLMKTQNAIKLVDIRSQEEHDAVALEGSVLLSRQTMSEIMNDYPKNGLLVFYDHQGHSVLDAATYFAGHGFTNVRCLKGGIDAWADQVDSSMPRYEVEQGGCCGGH